ncbi:circularly permuted type 2 ATP-grasp protein [Pseudaquidulcibacter saccharophilus]|uniref:circularly permuted type 2 ATP-grasp protein n=1 Tax=Pseudaquidulcibacter saccharophilus TaxID=2831900 RepID=UPI001EFF4017|nr:circularly permuted type 2 ATP-grasp protein [Pseudaquidulcibacter saccharophilus]
MKKTGFDEMWGGGNTRSIRKPYLSFAKWVDEVSVDEMLVRQASAEQIFRKTGITFAVYSNDEAEERIIPFDIVPRIIAGDEWDKLSEGLIQRANAINMFLSDIYGKKEIMKAGILPEDLIYANPQYRLQMTVIKPPHDVWSHISGIDIVRTGADEFFVLEDNARTPSGVSYMLEDREAMQRLFPSLIEKHKIRPVSQYTDYLIETLRSVAPPNASADPMVVILTPGPYNSAFYEHSFLADRTGAELVEGSDLFVKDRKVFMRTTEGPQQVDVIYRRVDDDFIDPLMFNPDSMLGVPGLMDAYAQGNVTIVNAPGTGIADDKAIYSYMPEIIKFYTGKDAIIPNVETYRCREPDKLKYVNDNLDKLVVKLVDGSGGYGMLVGPTSTKAQIEDFRKALLKEPHRFIAQPTLALSTCPTLTEKGLCPRHVDLRPFILTGSNGVKIVPGGLTRVALTEGSLVVNSSQGGGTKDTWVVDENNLKVVEE